MEFSGLSIPDVDRVKTSEAKAVIERVFERGNDDEKGEIIRFSQTLNTPNHPETYLKTSENPSSNRAIFAKIVIHDNILLHYM